VKKQLQRSKTLEKGDKVALIAPAGPLLQPERLNFAIKFLKSLSLIPICGKSCIARHGYLAGEDNVRAGDINWAFADTDIKGIFCIRGGYGSARILNKIDFGVIKKNPKFFCGYSDITALHIAVNQKADLMTFHTPMPCETGFSEADAYTLHFLHKFMFNPAMDTELYNPQGSKWEFMVNGYAEGPICGGNLTVISSLMGTPYEIDTRDKILFLEDIGEEPYKIDRMLNQLQMAGKFDVCAGVVFGNFADCEPKNPTASLTIPEIIKGLRLQVPVLYNFACGHCMPTASLPLGCIAALDSCTNTFKILQK